MKLTLKHLAPYLPYKLKMSEQNLIYVLAGFNGNSMLLYEKGDPSVEIFDAEIIEQSVKPILRPLSDLTKEITVNGETFVPIVELAKIAYSKWGIEEFKLIDNYVNFSNYSFLFDKIDNGFDCRARFDGIYWDYNCFVPQQLQLFEKLFEWHFDVFNLIENELVIDINILEK